MGDSRLKKKNQPAVFFCPKRGTEAKQETLHRGKQISKVASLLLAAHDRISQQKLLVQRLGSARKTLRSFFCSGIHQNEGYFYFSSALFFLEEVKKSHLFNRTV